MSEVFELKTTQDNGMQRKSRIPLRVGSGKHRPLSKSEDNRQARTKSENARKIKKEDNSFIDENCIGSLSVGKEICNSEQKVPSENNEKYFSEEENNKFVSQQTEIDSPIELKQGWKIKKEQFEKMRNDLNERQGTIIEKYAALKTTEEKLALLGQKISSPIINNDLRIMNVAKLTPQQLLQLCEEMKNCSGDISGQKTLTETYFNIDIKIIYNIQSKVHEICEEALNKSKEMFDWIKKDLSQSKNKMRINDFKVEYDILNNKVQAVKTELGKDLNEITNVMRKCVNETIAVSLHNQDLTKELSQLNSKNSLLQKQINNKDQVLKTHPSKIKIEKLENKLKEEKLKNVTAKHRIKKLENESKINSNQVTRLEVALNQARAQEHVLERTIQNQHEQNQQSQKEFTEDLCKLTESIKENSEKIEIIAEAKTNLQNEKEELEIRLKSLSEEYNTLIHNLKMEISSNAIRVVEIEKKYKQELDEKTKLQNTVQTHQFQLEKKDEHYRQTLKLLHETEAKLSETLRVQQTKDYVTKVNKDLERTLKENENLNKKIIEQSEIIEAMKMKIDSTRIVEEQLRGEINKKIKLIEDQEKRYLSLQEKAKESELKQQLYENQLITIKEYIKSLKEKHKENDELNNTISEKNKKIQELIQHNDEMTRELHNQAKDLKACMHTISTQEEHIREKDDLLSKLTKEEKKVNKTDNEINGKFIKKDFEIESLIMTIGIKQKRISQMESVIIALYDKARKTKLKNKKYQGKINILKQVISEYETYIDSMNDSSPSEIRFLQILEYEIDLPADKHYYEKRTPIKSHKESHYFIQRDHSLSRGDQYLRD